MAVRGRAVFALLLCAVQLAASVACWTSFLLLCARARERPAAFAGVVLAVAVPHAVTFALAAKNDLLTRRLDRPSLPWAACLGLAVRSLVEVAGVALLAFRVFLSQSGLLSTSFSCGVAAVPALVRWLRTLRCTRGLRYEPLPPARGRLRRCGCLRPADEAGGGGDDDADGDAAGAQPLIRKRWWEDVVVLVLIVGGLVLVSTLNREEVWPSIVGVVLVSVLWFDVDTATPVYDPQLHRHRAALLQSLVSAGAVVGAAAAAVQWNAQLQFGLHDVWAAVPTLAGASADVGVLVLVNAATGFAAYEAALVACGVCLQSVGFGVPVALTPVLCYAAMALHCWHGELAFLSVRCPEGVAGPLARLQAWETGAFVVLYASFVLATRYIFVPFTGAKLPLESDIFVRPGYSTILPLQWLAYNRKSTVPAYASAAAARKTVACATLYRESEKEMRQLLESLLDLARDWPRSERGPLLIKVFFDKPFAAAPAAGAPAAVLNEFGACWKRLLDEHPLLAAAGADAGGQPLAAFFGQTYTRTVVTADGVAGVAIRTYFKVEQQDGKRNEKTI